VRDGVSEEEFVRAAESELEANAEPEWGSYTQAGPLWQSYSGLKRYWEKKVSRASEA
jgi:hypothetical protein